MEAVAASPENGWKLTNENFHHKVLMFRERQAGVSLVYDPEGESFVYNAYCVELKLYKELFTCEFEFLDDALELVNQEFGTWELFDLAGESGCGSCVAK